MLSSALHVSRSYKASSSQFSLILLLVLMLINKILHVANDGILGLIDASERSI